MRALCLPCVLLFLALACLTAQTPPPVVIQPQDLRLEEHRMGPEQVLHKTQQEIDSQSRRDQRFVFAGGANYCSFQLIVSPAGFVESAKLKSEEACSPHEQAAETIVRGRRYEPWLVHGHPARVQIEDYVSVLPPERWGPQVAFPEKIDRSTLRFTLERTSCYGSCPSYNVSVDGDGTVTYGGSSNVAITGHHTAHIELAKVDALLARFRAANFLSALPKYQAAVTDNPTQTVTLSFNGQTKKVVDYVGVNAGLPWAIRELEDAVDQTAGTRRWIKPSGNILGLLQQEKWNFSADTADNLQLYRQAIERKDGPLIDTFLKAHAPPLSTAGKATPPVCVAARVGDVSLVEEMLQGQKNLPQQLKDRCLVDAAASGHLAMLDFWLRLGSNPKAGILSPEAAGMEDGYGNWLEQQGLLANAALSGNAALLRRVLEFHLDVNEKVQNQPLIQWVIGRGEAKQKVEIVEVLLAAGADPDAKDWNGETALFQCHYNPELVAPLVSAGANINARSPDGSTPLMRESFIEPFVRELLAHGADPSLTNRQGQTALDTARQYQCPACVKLIQDALDSRKLPN